MLSEKRQRLRLAETVLAQALSGRGSPPPGFDPKAIARAAAALREKRLHSAMHAWPALRYALGKEYSWHFAAYAATQSLPATPREDALGFAGFLRKRGKLPRELRREERWARLRAGLDAISRFLASMAPESGESTPSQTTRYWRNFKFQQPTSRKYPNFQGPNT
jgi:hypothetical protein